MIPAIQRSSVALYSGKKVSFVNVSWLQRDHQHNSGFVSIKKLDLQKASSSTDLNVCLNPDPARPEPGPNQH